MKILIDTNIFIKNFEICINDKILDEYEATIHKKIIKKKILDDVLYEKFLQDVKFFESVSDLKICRDPDDDKFINCAIDAKAIYIVSGDNDLLTIKNFAGIEIVTAREFYEKYLK